VNSGPDRNRVTIVFMGDGYTLEERTKFFEDIQRLVNGTSTFPHSSMSIISHSHNG